MGAGIPFNLLWTLQPPTAAGLSVLQMAMDVTHTGWVGFGIPVQPGNMIGASAVIVKNDASQPAGNPVPMVMQVC